MNLKGKPPLEIKDVRITGVEISGDGEAWSDFKQSDFTQTGGGLPHIIDLLTNGERVLVRTRYVDIYNNGTNGLPKVGATYELQLVVVQPLRQLIAATATEVEEGKALPAAPAGDKA
jgi:hypothetical protein